MPAWHPWAFCVICKLRRPLLKFHYLTITCLFEKINVWFLCLPLGFQGLWFRLGQSQDDLLIFIFIICKSGSHYWNLIIWKLLAYLKKNKRMIFVSIHRFSGSLIQIRQKPKRFVNLHIQYMQIRTAITKILFWARNRIIIKDDKANVVSLQGFRVSDSD